MPGTSQTRDSQVTAAQASRARTTPGHEAPAQVGQAGSAFKGYVAGLTGGKTKAVGPAGSITSTDKGLRYDGLTLLPNLVDRVLGGS